MNVKLTGMAVLNEPIDLGENKIYGVMFDPEFEEDECIKHTEFGTIRPYLAFHRGISEWIKNGGDVDDSCQNWTYPSVLGDERCLCDARTFMAKVLCHLYKDTVDYKSYVFDKPIEFNEDEVDKDEKRVIVSPSLIDRYTKENKSDDTEI